MWKEYMDELRESCFWGDLNCLCEGMDFPGFLWPIILLIARILSDSGSFRCACISFSQDGFTQKSLRGWQEVPPPFPDPWGSFLHMCGLEDLLDSKNMLSSYLFVLAELSSSLLLSFLWNVSKRQAPVAQPEAHLPSYLRSEVKWLRRAWFFATPWTVACTKLLLPWDFLGKSTGVGCRFLLQGIFPTERSNPGLPHCRQTLYRLSHQESNYLNEP